MLLSDGNIESELRMGELVITPFHRGMLQPSSVDVHLDGVIRIFNNHTYGTIDPCTRMDDLTTMIEHDWHRPFVLHPGQFVLGSTIQAVHMPGNIAARLEGKSSLGRIGLVVHSTAGFIDPGFQGQVTLEMSNMNTLPITLWPGMRIGQLCFFRMTSHAVMPYGTERGNRYQNQVGPVASRSWRQFERINRQGEIL